jgi:hypothetical protein
LVGWQEKKVLSKVSDTLVRQGYGKPFDYSAVIKPTGEVDFTPR